MFMYKEKGHPPKSPDTLKKLQAHSEISCFRFGACKHHGRDGYIIIPFYQVVNGNVLLLMHTHVRMSLYGIINQEAKKCLDDKLGPTRSGDEKWIDGLARGLEFYACKHYFERMDKLLDPNNAIVASFRPEVANLLRTRFWKDVHDNLDRVLLPKRAEDVIAMRIMGLEDPRVIDL